MNIEIKNAFRETEDRHGIIYIIPTIIVCYGTEYDDSKYRIRVVVIGWIGIQIIMTFNN